MLLEEMRVDQLKVEIYEDRAAMGRAAAQRVAGWMRQILGEQEQVSMIFAAAPSQNEFLAELCQIEDLEWDRVVAMHMDEYIGLPADAPQAFGNFLRERLFDIVKPGMVYYLNGNAADLEVECQRYTELLKQNSVDIVCAGIGENGHLAFNDPHVADFDDPELVPAPDRVQVKVVKLDHRCREQQVHDGCFAQLGDVPAHALTLTIPALMADRSISCVVPGPTKAEAVKRTLRGPVSTECPATILRQHDNAVLFIDQESAARL